jgi:hypothetical protein
MVKMSNVKAQISNECPRPNEKYTTGKLLILEFELTFGLGHLIVCIEQD